MYCSNCGNALGDEMYCPHCGTPTNASSSATTPIVTVPPVTAPPTYHLVPEEIKKWNWGAFCFNIIWGFGNETYLPLLCFIPYFNLIWMFVCGAKGNEWAWKSGNYRPEDVNTFLAIQKSWDRGGLFKFLFGIFSAVFIIFLAFFMALLISSLDPSFTL